MPRSIEEGFLEQLRRLAPLDSERAKSVRHKKSVYSRLIKSFECNEFFETGSFGNRTGVKHYSDTDYFAVCPDYNLSINSSTALKEVKKALQYTFPRTAPWITVATPSVRIPFGNYASENLEITPCFFHKIIDTPLGKKRSYGIPDGKKGWMISSPRAHKAYVTDQDKRLARKLKPLITLIKAWKFYNDVPISSFYLELRITKLTEEKKKIDYAKDVSGTMKKLLDIELADITDPMGVSGRVHACKTKEKKRVALSKLKTGCRRAQKALAARDPSVCFEWWKKFYNWNFPAR